MIKYWSEAYKNKLVAPEHLEKFSAQLKKEGKKITTLNGSFDLLHAGHLQILYEASLQGDILIIGLNTDASIKKYKSAQRPFVPLEFRLQMVAALEFVDYLTWFEETTPCEFIKKVQPAVHVNGSEYGNQCIEADIVKQCGGEIYIVERIPGFSTTELTAKIALLMQEGSHAAH